MQNTNENDTATQAMQPDIVDQRRAKHAKPIPAQNDEATAPFLFSVVIAAYNAADYVGEAIDSLVAQTVGFESIQVIVVNDGSTDATADVVGAYVERYPDNVVLISQENAGVSAARNAGLELVRGRYVNFLDADDKWTKTSFATALDFFERFPDAPFAASRYTYFGARTGGHRLNYKFTQDRIVNLLEEHDMPQLSSSTCFFKTETIGERRFATELSVSEDTRFVNEILIDNPQYGLMRKPKYLYRQKTEHDSAINTMKENVGWYTATPEHCSWHLFELSREVYGHVVPFIQYTVMYDLQWRIRAPRSTVLDERQLADYRKNLAKLLHEIDDEIVAEQKTLTIDQEAYAFALKYHVTMDDILAGMLVEDGMLKTRITPPGEDERIVSFRELDELSDRLNIESIGFEDGLLMLGGYIASFRFRPADVVLTLFANNRPNETLLGSSATRLLQNPFDDDIVGKTAFACAIPLAPGEEVRLKAVLTLLDSAERELRFHFTPESGMPDKYREGLIGTAGPSDELDVSFGSPFALTIHHVNEPRELSPDEPATEESPQEEEPAPTYTAKYPKYPWTAK